MAIPFKPLYLFIFIVCAFPVAHAKSRLPVVVEGDPQSWRVVRDDHYSSGIPTPCPGKTIPEDKSRFADNIRIGCRGSSTDSKTRFPEPVPNMHHQDTHVNWSGQLSFDSVVDWTWKARVFGRNGRQCGYDEVPAICTREVRTFRQKQKCQESSELGAGTVNTANPSFTGNRTVCEKESEISSTDEEYPCFDKFARECEWEEERSESLFCEKRNIAYTATMVKPGPEWNPSHRDYHDMIPNKYDLLPGEWETFATTLNADSSGINVAMDQPKNAWNNYAVDVSPSNLSCQSNTEVQIRINTLGRIKRRPPNPLSLAGNSSDPKHMRINFENSLLWEDTVFRLRLIRKEPGWWKRDILWTEKYFTTADLIAASGDILSIALSENRLTPGKEYEIRIAALPRNLKFYESGCQNEPADCEPNDKAFSHELIITFQAGSAENRTLFEKFLDFQRSFAR